MTSRTPAKTHNRMANLDALRGIAILLVMFSHLTISAFPDFGMWEITTLNFGTVGVLVFFCVSGYVISWSMADLVGKSGHQPLTIFLLRRVFRLVPTYFILAVLLMVFVASNVVRANIATAVHADPFGYLVRFVTLTSGFNGDPTVYGGLEWTLAYEVVFYAGCAVYLSINRHVSSSRFLYLPTILLSVMALLPTGSFNNVPQILGLRFEFFLIGVITCLWQRSTLSVIDFAIMLLVSVSSIFERLVLTTAAYHHYYSETFASPIAILMFFFVLLFWKAPPRLLSATGVISYSLYLLHSSSPVILPLPMFPVWLRPEAWAVIAASAATACYFLVERRSIAAGKWTVRRIRLREAPAGDMSV